MPDTGTQKTRMSQERCGHPRESIRHELDDPKAVRGPTHLHCMACGDRMYPLRPFWDDRYQSRAERAEEELQQAKATLEKFEDLRQAVKDGNAHHTIAALIELEECQEEPPAPSPTTTEEESPLPPGPSTPRNRDDRLGGESASPGNSLNRPGSGGNGVGRRG